MTTLEKEPIDTIQEFPGGIIARNGVPMKGVELARYRKKIKLMKRLKSRISLNKTSKK